MYCTKSLLHLAEKLLLLLEIIIANVHSSKGIYAAHLYCFISSFFPQVTQLFLQLFTVFFLKTGPAKLIFLEVKLEWNQAEGEHLSASQSAFIIDVEKAEYKGLLWCSDSCALFIPVWETSYFNYCFASGW